jgi:virulence-associated protein VagC
MTDNAPALHDVPADERLAIKLQRDKHGQSFELPTGWKFTNNKVTVHKAESALVLAPGRHGKPRLP